MASGTKNDGGNNNQNLHFQKGTFKVANKEAAIAVAEEIMKYKVHAGYTKNSFVAAISTLMKGKKCDMDKLYKKFAAAPEELPLCGSAKEYLRFMEEIYNKYGREREVIF